VEYKKLAFVVFKLQEDKKYRTVANPKRKGGLRELNVPMPFLKLVQRKLADVLLQIYRPLPGVHSFIKDDGIKKNAEPHKESTWVFTVDLKDFFPSINFGRVRGLFLNKPFNFNPDVATFLAKICTHKNGLPQGAPSSPIISNFVCFSLDLKLFGLAKQYGCFYTRYADDIAFSKRVGFFPDEIGIRVSGKTSSPGKSLAFAIEKSGFEINHEKVYLKSNREKQRVTGLIVNKKVNVNRIYIRQLRGLAHACRKFGVESALIKTKSLRNLKKLKDLGAYVDGKLSFLKHIKGEFDSAYISMLRNFGSVFPKYQDEVKEILSKMESKDFFISHASEDKDEIVRPLADALIEAGISVWYDEYTLQIGDSLRQKIDEGLAVSRFGIVILSNKFFEKKWPAKELNGLISRQVEGTNIIIPIRHKISQQEILKNSPLVADILSINSDKGIPFIVQKLKALLSSENSKPKDQDRPKNEKATQSHNTRQ
jgi:retron-type reverse transcriptase